MSTTHTIPEVKKFPIGTVVPHLSGTVKVVFARKTGEGQYGPWSVQSAVLADGPDEINVSCWGFDDLSHLKGQTVTVAATGKDRRSGKTQGVELAEGKDKQGTPRAELKISHNKGGFIGGDTPNPAHMAQTASPAPAVKAPETAIPSVLSHSDAKQGSSITPDAFNAKMGAMRRLYSHCWASALATMPETDLETIRAISTTFFIQGVKDGLLASAPELTPVNDENKPF